MLEPFRKFLAPDLGLGFEWQPEGGRLFVIYSNGKLYRQIASRVPSPDIAEKMVIMWCAGYRTKRDEVARNPKGKHSYLFAETMPIGTRIDRGRWLESSDIQVEE